MSEFDESVSRTMGAGRIEPRELEQEMRTSFLDYSMSVIVSRALPDVRDGLKPVHRRVLYAMNELGLQPNRERIKCARVVGDVMGKYHPHGDQAIYDTLVRMAQPFSLRYPLVDPQGNFGNVDGYPAAAERYTECRLARDRRRAAARHRPGHDRLRPELRRLRSASPPCCRPASRTCSSTAPTGIAVGMATNMPPHNLGETIDAIVAMIDDPTIDVERLTPARQGPGLPDRRDHPRPRGHPRGVPLGPRPDPRARARAHRGAARRQDRDHRHRAARTA